MIETQCQNYRITVWKLQKDPITQILREIKVGKCRVSKPVISTHLEAVNFDFHAFLHLFEG